MRCAADRRTAWGGYDGRMPQVRFARVGSRLGPIWLAETDAGIVAASREDSPDALLTPLRRRFPDMVAVPTAIDATWLLDGGPPPRIDLRGLPDFRARVYRIVSRIPAGQTLTYGDVAALAGAPRAARAVGNAMARCPLFPVVPCHRVVRASDGWSGWSGDDRLKRALLAQERDGSHPASPGPSHGSP